MNKYHVEKYILQWMLGSPSKKVQGAIEKDKRLPIFEKVWGQYNTKRGTRRFLAQRKLNNLFSNLIISMLSYDVAIKQTNRSLNMFWNPIKHITPPLQMKMYRLLQPCGKVPDDYHIRLFNDLMKESKQRGTRGNHAKTKLKNLVYHVFYLIDCREDTYTWLKKLLESH